MFGTLHFKVNLLGWYISWGWVFNFGSIDCTAWNLRIPNETETSHDDSHRVAWDELLVDFLEPMYFKSGDPFHLFWCLIQNLLRLDLQHQIERAGCQYALSPVAHMCWTDEDMIGRVSRLSRRCHPLTTTRRCLERALCNYRRQFGTHFSTSYLQKQGSWCDKIEDSYLKVVSRILFNLEVLNIIVF